MAWRTGHGTQKGRGPRIEQLPTDELPLGVPAPASQFLPTDHDAKHRFAKGNSMAKEGGRAKAGMLALTSKLTDANLPPDHDFLPYIRKARAWRRAYCRTLAQTVGGGVCGPGPSANVLAAARLLAWASYWGDIATRSGDVDMVLKSARLYENMKQQQNSAHELCAKEAIARKQHGPSAHDALLDALTMTVKKEDPK